MNSAPPTPDMLRRISRSFENASPREILEWGFETFGQDFVLATSFGPSGIVLMDLTARLRPDATIFYLDTDLLFPETYALRDELAARYGIRFTRVHGGLSLDAQATAHGPALWASEPDRCCTLRKVEPLRRYLADKRAWATGLRRDQSPGRSATPIVGWDAANGLVKLNPLAHWSGEDVWGYIRLNDLPYNPLHDDGYPSVGCIPCTRAVAPGEDVRAGRWAGLDKTECGIHVQPDIDLIPEPVDRR